MRVLIVDDQPNVRLLLSRILRKTGGCTVSEATNGIEALDLLGRQHVDLVVLDVLMPLMDGIETLEAIRRTPSLRHLPVVVLSAVRDEGKVRQLVGHGIAAYLAKPLRPLDVAERLQGLLTRLAASSDQPSRGLSRVSPGSRVVVVDGHADFRRVVREALPEYCVTEAATGARGLRLCLDQRPALVVVGQELGALAQPGLLRKLRSLRELSAVRVMAAITGDAIVRDVDAVIQRTFVPQIFRQVFDRLIVEGASEPDVLGERAELRQQMIAATEQVFGMMLGIEVGAVATTRLPAAGDDVVRIGLRLDGETCDLEFTFAAPRSMSERMTSQFLQAGDVVTDADVSATLCEMATIISSRIQTALRHLGDIVDLGEPQVSRVRGHDELSDAGVCVCFASAAHDLRFMTTLRAVSRPSPVRDAPEGAPRPPRMDMPTLLQPPVDPDVFEMLASLQAEGEPDLVVELVTLFLRDTPRRLGELSVRPIDTARAGRVAHAVKGSAGNLGATGLQDIASALEQAAHRGDPADDLASLVEAVGAEYARVEEHLRRVLAERACSDSARLGPATLDVTAHR